MKKLFGLSTIRILVMCCFVGFAHAFKIPSHIATANKTLADLRVVMTNNAEADSITFNASGKEIRLGISSKEAYQAILDYPAFFRAGTIGPDGFPDVVSGQINLHGEASFVIAYQKQAFPDKYTETPLDAKLEEKKTPTRFASIDFAMKMYEYWSTYPFESPTKRAQALAFVMGYFGHCVGDAFMHTWVNRIAKGSWSYTHGSGVFGPETEEIKHIASEGYVDHALPEELNGTQNKDDPDGTLIQAPVVFLDGFFSQRVDTPIDVGSLTSGEFIDFVKYYKDVDKFYGGYIYNDFNAQYDIAEASLYLTGTRDAVRLMDKYTPNDDYLTIINTALNVVDWPGTLQTEFQNLFNVDVVGFLSMGTVDCSYMEHGTVWDYVVDTWRYMGGFRNRLDRYKQKAVANRRNFLKLSECTVQNIARGTHGIIWDKANPNENRDACAVLAEEAERNHWYEAGYDNGLFGGNIWDPEYLSDATHKTDGLFAVFKGVKQDLLDPNSGLTTLESRGEQYQFGSNMGRVKDYLTGPGVIVGEMNDVIFGSEGTTFSQKFDKVCEFARSTEKQRCLQLQLLAFGLTYEAAKCTIDWGKCAVSAVETAWNECRGTLCYDACRSASFDFISADLCRSACNSANGGCRSVLTSPCDVSQCVLGYPTLDGWHCSERVSFEIPYCKSTLGGMCDMLTGNFKDPICVAATLGVEEAKCGVEAIKCGGEAIYDAFYGIIDPKAHGYASKIMQPLAQGCNAIDAYRNFYRNYDTPEEKVAFLKRHGVPLEELDQIRRTYDAVMKPIREMGAAAMLDFVFLYDDLKQDPAYFRQWSDKLAEQKLIILSESDSESKNAKLRTITKLEGIKNAIKSGTAFNWFQQNDPLSSAFLSSSAADLQTMADAIRLNLGGDVVPATRRKINADLGNEPVNTFWPFYNTVQGLKLIPINSKSDIQKFIAQHGGDVTKLPWTGSQSKYSSICSNGSVTNVYCDVILSLDNPDAYPENVQDIRRNPDANNFTQWRSLVAWNEYDPDKVQKDHVLTRFPFASSDVTYDKLYVNIFRVPVAAPAWFGFNKLGEWTSTQGTATLDQTYFTEGGKSYSINQAGWQQWWSPIIRTVDLGIASHKMTIDLFIPSEASNPWWLGNIELSVNNTTANIPWKSLGLKEITSMKKGAWNTVDFLVPDDVFRMFLGDYPNLQFRVTMNVNDEGFKLDNLRFVGDVVTREVMHSTNTQNQQDVISLPQWNFNSEWTTEGGSFSQVASTLDASRTALLSNDGWSRTISSEFSSKSFAALSGSKLHMNLFVPNPQVNPWWLGTVDAKLSCPTLGLYDYLIGSKSLTNFFQNEWNGVDFTVTNNLKSTLNSADAQCKLRLTLNTNVPNNGFMLDNLSMIP